MCGRCTLYLDENDILNAFELDELLTNWAPKYNVAPSQQVLAVTGEQPRAAAGLTWGINIHSEREQRDIQLINIRSETVLEKGHFRQPRYKPCLILANGFYEWRRDTGKQPFFFHLTNNEPFAFAGLWTTEKQAGKETGVCAILTCQPNSVVSGVHNRMPVILPKEIRKEWLQAQSLADYKRFLVPYPAERMSSHPVGKQINRPTYDAPDCISEINAG
ncbi:MAG TPA: SOS response-associated peptidase [Longilinea sp.]|nr:SOS response-associated peptidase [Longilinea sp.]